MREMLTLQAIDGVLLSTIVTNIFLEGSYNLRKNIEIFINLGVF